MMDQPPPSGQPARNPLTYHRHRQEVTWQIIVPLVIGAVVVLSVAIFSVAGTTAGIKSQMADIALIQLIIPALFFGLITLLILAGMVYGLTRLLGILPYYSIRAQIFFLRVHLGVAKTGDRLVSPVVSIRRFNARAYAFRRSVRKAFWFR